MELQNNRYTTIRIICLIIIASVWTSASTVSFANKTTQQKDSISIDNKVYNSIYQFLSFKHVISKKKVLLDSLKIKELVYVRCITSDSINFLDTFAVYMVGHMSSSDPENFVLIKDGSELFIYDRHNLNAIINNLLQIKARYSNIISDNEIVKLLVDIRPKDETNISTKIGYLKYIYIYKR